MINRFNFYDVYGYFLPGLMFLVLLGLPIVLVTGRVPHSEIASAVLAVGLAYIAGHLLQTLGVVAFPSSVKVGSERRAPSDIVLNANDNRFSPTFKASVAAKILDAYGFDVIKNPEQRGDAFFVCRSALIKNGTASYGEQFEGMYSLMRGLTVAFLLGAAHNAGWALAFFPGFRRYALWALLGGAALGVIAELSVSTSSNRRIQRPFALISLSMVATALLAGGYLLAIERTLTPHLYFAFAFTTLASFFCARKCFKSYLSFTWEFAKAVYRDFLTYEKPGNADEPGA